MQIGTLKEGVARDNKTSQRERGGEASRDGGRKKKERKSYTPFCH